jgi:hypothetical protein
MKMSYSLPNFSTPLPHNVEWTKKFNAATGDPDEKFQAALAKPMQLTYCSSVGELIWAMTTCHPDFAYTSMKLSQFNTSLDKIHYYGLKHALKFLYNSCNDGLYFWRTAPVSSFPMVLHPASTVIRMTSSLMVTHNSMHLLHTPLLILTGPHALKLDNLLVVSAYGSSMARLHTNTNSNPLWLAPVPESNLWLPATQGR